MLDGEDDFEYLRAEKARRQTEMRKELTMCMVELLQASRPLLKVFPEAGRRARSLHDLYAKVEELDAAAEEAKKAGEHAKAVELAKQAEEQLSTFEEGHEYTTLADRPDQWKMLRAVGYKDRVILPPASAPAMQGSALGVDGTANQGCALGVPAADPSFGLGAPQMVAMNTFYLCRASTFSCLILISCFDCVIAFL